MQGEKCVWLVGVDVKWGGFGEKEIEEKGRKGRKGSKRRDGKRVGNEMKNKTQRSTAQASTVHENESSPRIQDVMHTHSHTRTRCEMRWRIISRFLCVVRVFALQCSTLSVNETMDKRRSKVNGAKNNDVEPWSFFFFAVCLSSN